MSVKKRIVLTICFLLLMLTASSCSKGKNKAIDNQKNFDVPKYPNIMIMENKSDKINFYKADQDSMTKMGSMDNVREIVYNNNNSIVGLLMPDKDNLKKNTIRVISGKGENIIDGFYFAKDLRLSPNGENLAYRSFKDQSLDSAQGLSLYSVENNKKIDFESQVLTSGNLYAWISDEEILYYGASVKDGKNTGIFKYNTKEHKEEMYVGNIKGYCTYFMPLGDKILILSRDIEENKLYIYNKGKDESINISNNIENVYDGIFDRNNNLVYIIASEKNVDIPTLYKINLTSYKIERINYDFPKIVDPDGGLRVDSNGLLYYCGFTSLEENTDNNNDVFMYNPKENSNNLISIDSSQYKINGSN
jgi:hypothetical protein